MSLAIDKIELHNFETLAVASVAVWSAAAIAFAAYVEVVIAAPVGVVTSVDWSWIFECLQGRRPSLDSHY